jgi:hypothetical protein
MQNYLGYARLGNIFPTVLVWEMFFFCYCANVGKNLQNKDFFRYLLTGPLL